MNKKRIIIIGILVILLIVAIVSITTFLRNQRLAGATYEEPPADSQVAFGDGTGGSTVPASAGTTGDQTGGDGTAEGTLPDAGDDVNPPAGGGAGGAGGGAGAGGGGTTTVSQERITGEETTVGWSNLALAFNVDLTKGIRYTDLKYTVEYYYDGVLDPDRTEMFGKKVIGDIVTATEEQVEDNLIDGYKYLETIDALITPDLRDNVVKVYYIKDEFAYTVEYYYDDVKDTTKTEVYMATFEDVIEDYEDKVIDGYKLDKEENLPLTITSDPDNNVIKVYYVKDDFAYTVEYYYDNVKDGDLTYSDTATFEDVITTYPPQPKTGYKWVSDTAPLTIGANETENVIKVYYVKDDFAYTVEYYYDNVKDGDLTYSNTATFEDVITTYPPQPKTGYKWVSDTAPLTIGANETENVIKVYYVKEPSGTVRVTKKLWKEEKEDISFTATLQDLWVHNNKKGEEQIRYIYADSTTGNVYRDDVIIKVTLVVADTGNPHPVDITIELAPGVVVDDTISGTFKFSKSELTLTNIYTDGISHRYILNTSDTNAASSFVLNFGKITVNGSDVLSSKYSYSQISVPNEVFAVRITGTSDYATPVDRVKIIENGVAIFDDIPYGDNYIVQEIDADAYFNNDGEIKEIGSKYGIVITKDGSYTLPATIENKLGYTHSPILYPVVINSENANVPIYIHNIEKAEETVGMGITPAGAMMMMSMSGLFSVKQEFAYTIEYYYEGIIDDSKTISGPMHTLELGDIITDYPDKLQPEYKLDRVENCPLTITEIEANNIIRIYYVKDVAEETNDNETKTDEKSSGAENNNEGGSEPAETNNEDDKPEANNTKKEFGYTIEYYYDGIIDENETITGEAHKLKLEGIITEYPDKSRQGYKLERDENSPLTITEIEKDNVIRVYYVKEDVVEEVQEEIMDESEAEQVSKFYMIIYQKFLEIIA